MYVDHTPLQRGRLLSSAQPQGTGRRHSTWSLIWLLLLLTGCAGGSGDDETVVLNYTEVEGDHTTAILSELDFEREKPDISPRPLTVYTETLSYEPYVLSLSTGSTAIDLYLLDAPWVKRYSATNWLSPLTELQDEAIFEHIRPELVEVMSRTRQDDMIPLAVPFETKGNVLFYRQDLLERYGFEPPQTWVELMQQSEEILRGEADPALFGFLFHGPSIANDFYPMMWSFGGGVFDEGGKLALSQPANVEALAFFKLMAAAIGPDPDQVRGLNIDLDYRAIDYLFAEGRAVFMINWNTRWNDFKAKLEGQRLAMDQIGVAPLPNDGEHDHYSNIGSFAWGVNLFSPHQQQARQLIRFITSYESQVWRALKAGIVPARTDVLNDERLRRSVPDVLAMARVFDQVRLRPRPYQRDINAILDDLLLRAVLEDLDPLAVLQAAEQQARQSLDRFRIITEESADE